MLPGFGGMGGRAMNAHHVRICESSCLQILPSGTSLKQICDTVSLPPQINHCLPPTLGAESASIASGGCSLECQCYLSITCMFRVLVGMQRCNFSVKSGFMLV